MRLIILKEEENDKHGLKLKLKILSTLCQCTSCGILWREKQNIIMKAKIVQLIMICFLKL